ncbi:hypothetical protein [Endozoicomonas sp. SCSIO W0465]|uniref:hypothetical protein n=1 Tax=Endozoicomonas sp. SCSIO W0465 TaxID=2918516 RepID=UPI002074ADD1|nr:hypothetical protein [Endozoicomonas sp. SCSIO W0465]USE38780.1 hypothetical protein MJO57_11765 [Endozoicomonas sp. SCSIO W0465]
MLPTINGNLAQIDRSDPWISQLREVIAYTKYSAQFSKPIPDSIKLLNAHIVLDIVKYSLEKPSTSDVDQLPGNEGSSRILKLLNIPVTATTGSTDTATLMQMAAIKDFMDIFDSGVHQLKRKLSDKGRQPDPGREGKKPNVDKPVERSKKPDNVEKNVTVQHPHINLEFSDFYTILLSTIFPQYSPA